MKIAIVAPSDRSYINNFLPQYLLTDLPEGYYGAPFIGTIIEELLKKGHSVVAITTTLLAGDDFALKEFSHKNFTWVTVPARLHSFRAANAKKGRMIDFYAYERRQLLNVIKKHEPDFVHAHWSYEFAAAAIASGIPCLITIHDNPYQVLRFFKNLYRFCRLLMAEYFLRQARFISTVSPYMLNYTKKYHKTTKLIPNPVPVLVGLDKIEILIKGRIGRARSPKFCMINNGWDGRKNGKCGLQAFKYVLRLFPNAELHLFGKGSEPNGLACIDASAIDVENVYFHGNVNHDLLIEELKTAHILIHPAIEESFGVVLVEAMSLGVPAIGGENAGGVPWVLNDSRLLLDITDAEAISVKICGLLNDVHLYHDVAISCYKNMTDRFSAPKIVQDYLSYYDSIISTW